MTSVLVFGAFTDGIMTPASLEAVGAARALGGTICGAVIGRGATAVAASFADQVGKVFVIDDERLSPYRAEMQVAAAAAILAECNPEIVLFPQTADVAEWTPLLAGALGAALATGCTGLAFEGDELVATRPVCGGAVLAEYAFNRPLRFATLVPGAFAPLPPRPAGTIVQVMLGKTQPLVEVLDERSENAGAGPRLRGAKIVVSGGLGVGSRENWRLVEDAAASLGAAVGATRAVVELGWVSPVRQVGFSGNKISPDLYLAIGISGAVHHLAGLGGTKAIVAINKDPDAAIFRAARFGVVGDATEVVPAFVARVRELRAGGE